jgi:hypothetical protein
LNSPPTLNFADLVGFEAEFPETATGLDLGLGEMTGHRLVHERCALAASRDLDRVVAIRFRGLHLGDAIRRRFDQRHRNRAPSSVKILLMPHLRPTNPILIIVS